MCNGVITGWRMEGSNWVAGSASPQLPSYLERPRSPAKNRLSSPFSPSPVQACNGIALCAEIPDVIGCSSDTTSRAAGVAVIDGQRTACKLIAVQRNNFSRWHRASRRSAADDWQEESGLCSDKLDSGFGGPTALGGLTARNRPGPQRCGRQEADHQLHRHEAGGLIPAGEFMMGSNESAEDTAAFFNKTYGER